MRLRNKIIRYFTRKFALNRNKVFCIGSQKTGTTSLGKALEILGFTPHANFNTSFRLIRALEEDVDLIFQMARKYRSFDDAPWCIGDFYKSLDEQFPGSKFILTVREVDRWIDSFLRWKTLDGTNTTDITKNFPNTQVAILSHRLSWGIQYDKLDNYRMEPHIDTYRNTFINRNAEIMEYFKKRPTDLLVFDLEKGHSWQQLCDFLSVPIPDVPFPHENKSTN